jgi:6,7-dimethyl-8-ribityllumazine synthase
MGNTYSGTLEAGGLRFGIVATRFNDFVVSRLVDGAKDRLIRHGADEEMIDVALVPGAFEVPLAASRMAASGRYDAVICLGAVIRGDTPHFDHVATQAARGIGQVSLDANLPVVFGVLTCDTMEQAIQRAGIKGGNKGAEAAEAAIEMCRVCRAIGS